MNKILTVSFHGTEMYAYQLGSIVFVALRPIVKGMGLDWSTQYRRIQRNPILSEGVAMMATPFMRGGTQNQVCLRLDLVQGWLFTVDAGRVRSALRDRILLYKRECYALLYKYFSGESERLLHQEPESESGRCRLVTECRHTFGVKAAQQLWRERGLPIVPAMAEAVAPPTQLELNFA